MTITAFNDKRFEKRAFYLLFFLLAARLVSIWFIPLNDTTEARYGEIARKMLETGNWVTPLHDYGIPFWAKPPLSTWFSALSMKFLGVNEWAARLPSLLLSMGVIGLVYYLAKKQRGKVHALTASLLLAGSLVFYLDAGAVMTDPAFLFSITLTMVAFWCTLNEAGAFLKKFWSYGFFVGLGLGFLAKGPLILVLTGLPIFFWCIKEKAWFKLWSSFPWIMGLLLTTLIALPWYWLAEKRTPGFLNYFIVGEHINRFLKPGWTGDKYGFAHHAPLGMIWCYALISLLPWIFPLCTFFIRKRKQASIQLPFIAGWRLFLWLWFLLPLLFFSFAANIIYPYVLPAMPAAALLLAEFLTGDYYKIWILRLAPFSGLLFLIATSLFIFKPVNIEKSQKSMVASWNILDPLHEGHLIYWGEKLDASAQFYSSGKALIVHDPVALQSLVAGSSKNVLVIASDRINELPITLRHKMKIMNTLFYGSKKISVFSYGDT